MNRLQVIDCCDKHWNPTAATLYHMSHRTIEHRAEGSWIEDEEGNRFLDFACSYGVFIVGHANPHVQAAACDQLARIATLPYGMMEPSQVGLMQRLARMLPGDLNRVWLTNSGAEACEIALRAVLAARAPRRRIIVARDSYHGKTLGALNILGQHNHRNPFDPLMRQVDFVPYGDLAALSDAMDSDVAAVFLEPVLGGPYLQVPVSGYVKQVELLCREHGALFVADEIQTAFGRAGRMFAIEYDAAQPDIILLSKGMTGGHAAIAATVMSDRLYETLTGLSDFDADYLASGAGASPFACATALASLDFIERENLPERAQRLGVRLISGLRRLARQYPALIEEAPGIGLMTGLKVRNPAVESAITMVMGRHGIHLGHSMNESADHPVLRFYPPLTVTEGEIELCLDKLAASLEQIGSRPVKLFDCLNLLVRRQYRLPRWFVYRLTGVKQT